MNLTQHFTSEEFNRENLHLDDIMITNLRQLALYLELVRIRFGKPIIITSGYRSPKHNEEVGGVKNSQHLYCKAVDITCSNPKDYDQLAFAASLTINPESLRYMEFHPQKKFIHIHFGDRGYGLLDIWQYLPFVGNTANFLNKKVSFNEIIVDINKDFDYEE